MLCISHKLKVIFLHIPKTGGTSITQHLRQFDKELAPISRRGSHEPISFVSSAVPDAFETYVKFAVVRNPWARAVSLFSFRKKRLRQSPENWPQHWPEKSLIETMSFRNMVLRSQEQNQDLMDFCPPRDSGEISWLEPSCSAWINMHGKIAVDRVLNLETLDADFSVLCKELDLPSTPLAHVKQSKHSHYATYYDRETRELVAQRYASDVEAFGYSFGA